MFDIYDLGSGTLRLDWEQINNCNDTTQEPQIGPLPLIVQGYKSGLKSALNVP